MSSILEVINRNRVRYFHVCCEQLLKWVKVGHDNVFDAVYRDFEAKKSPGRKGSFSEDYRTSYLVLSEFCSLSFQVSGAG